MASRTRVDAAQEAVAASAATRSARGDRVGRRFERSYRYTVVDTVGGGTSEIQKNIIARRGLGLPQSF